MAVVDTLSTELTNLDADPRVLAEPQHWHGRVRIKSATAAVAAADDDGSLYRFVRVKSSDSLKSIQIYCDAVTGATDYDCGLYTIGSGGAEVDADLYADGLNFETAAPAVPHVVATAPYIEARFGDASTALPQDVNNRVWEDLGLAADPGLEYDLVLTANTVGSGAGDITMIVYYTAGD
jgi:hypothetical protein